MCKAIWYNKNMIPPPIRIMGMRNVAINITNNKIRRIIPPMITCAIFSLL